MPRKAIASNSALGRQLIKSRYKAKRAPRVEGEGPKEGYRVHTCLDNPDVPNLGSVLEQNSLDEFMQLAELSRRKFEAERGGAHLVYNQETILEDENEGMISKFQTGQPKT